MTGEADMWNMLVTAQEGYASDLRRELRRLGRFWWAGYRNVIVGEVEECEGFLQSLVELCERKAFVGRWIGKALPIAMTFPVAVETFTADAERALTARLDQVAGRSFYLRIERRGHKGQLSTHELEVQLGDFVGRALHERGHTPVITFSDPDVVLAVEIVGPSAGIAIITRELRQRFPVVRIR